MGKPNQYTEYEWSGVRYFPAPGTTRLALISDGGHEIKYMERSHIEVWASLDDFTSATQLLRPMDWDVSPKGDEVVLVRPTLAGQYYAVQRVTPFSPYINFADGSQLAAIHLNRFANVDLFRDQELSDHLTSVQVEGGSNDYTLPPATKITLGGVIAGDGLTILPNGRLSTTGGFTLNPATAAVLGGIKVGSRLSVTGDGTLSANAQSYSEITGKPTFATVATTGQYGDLLGKPAAVVPASISTAGIVRLNDTLYSPSAAEAATASTVKQLNELLAAFKGMATPISRGTGSSSVYTVPSGVLMLHLRVDPGCGFIVIPTLPEGAQIHVWNDTSAQVGLQLNASYPLRNCYKVNVGWVPMDATNNVFLAVKGLANFYFRAPNEAPFVRGLV